MKLSLKWLIDECPPSVAACESECRSTTCTHEFAKTCTLRASIEAAITKDVRGSSKSATAAHSDL